MSSSTDAGTATPSPSLPGYDVIYENDEVLVVNKPADVPMDGDLRVYGRTVESMVHAHMKERGLYDEAHERLRQDGKRKKQLKFVHQLDYSTSGVLCLAFTKDMAARLAHCFEMRTTRKYYVALLHGHMPNDAIKQTISEENLSRRESANQCHNHTGLFRAWVDQWQAVWQDLGSVRADACADFSAERNKQALDEFRSLLRHSPSAAGVDGAAAVAATYGGAEPPTVHRHRATAPIHNTSPRAAALHDDLVHQLLADAAAAAASLCSLTVDLPVGYDVTDPAHFRMAVAAEQSRPASSSLLVLKRTYMETRAANERVPVTLVLLSPHTGRRHQLRVHCRALGFPIVGDSAYCADLPWCRSITPEAVPSKWSRMAASRMYLHAWRLVLPGSVASHVSESERVALKKKRRRETLGVSERDDAAVAAQRDEWTEFVAPLCFPDVVMDD
ncbi:hypothetical protein ABB37_02863 [Leptomonas pyrrhocoris]|uniref:Pseudouridine synthase RsuA/RluA-like domain-containing protein n=1 Tax=Leptomonas pyrrhocoris TaxID=157538 RepID=A0A0N0DXM9_LEPPY|nr:hypothetical protein ABB37_02863 [Leptomonas pyrrhocoris]KPA83168.1 hypothetical protein ABB37_02863 [Leptomonas pyrrhocoris]|eukprot:XP_015661607.1 hypothetical protein ABB37_02863 [Leptomonas pyrrhocoris]